MDPNEEMRQAVIDPEQKDGEYSPDSYKDFIDAVDRIIADSKTGSLIVDGQARGLIEQYFSGAKTLDEKSMDEGMDDTLKKQTLQSARERLEDAGFQVTESGSLKRK